MTQLRLLPLALLCLGIAGCSNTPGDGSTAARAADAAAETGAAPTLALSTGAKIQFVGTHVKGEPNPRTGVFKKVSVKAEVDFAAKSLKSVSVEIETDSLSTSIEKLDNHLRNEDFFDVREYPTARFESTSVKPAEGKDGEYVITGKLTLLKATKEVSFPATISFENGLTLKGGLTIDRTEFGMDRLQDSVHKEVEITVEIDATL